MKSSIRRYVGQHHLALLALFVALGGTAYAAVQLPKDSVGSRQLKSNSVKAPETAKNSVGSSEVRNSSLRCKDFTKGSGACAGPPNLTVRSKTVTLAQTCFTTLGTLICSSPRTPVTARCEPGERAASGGYKGTTTESGTSPMRSSDAESVSRPDPPTGVPTGWTVAASGSAEGPAGSDPPPPTFTVYAVCAR